MNNLDAKYKLHYWIKIAASGKTFPEDGSTAFEILKLKNFMKKA
jgi:hypothetical protein